MPSGMFPSRKPPLSHSHATLSVSHPQAPPLMSVLGRPKATLKSSSLELLRPSAFADRTTLLLTPRGASGNRCPDPRKSHPQGLATLSVTSVVPPLEASFSSPRSWASPFRAFLLPRGRKGVSTSPSARALPTKTFPASIRRSDGLIPREKPVPFFAPGKINSGRGQGSPGPSNLSGSPSRHRTSQVSLPSSYPLRVISPHPLRNGLDSPSGPSQ
jgi:hypothetical protein